jgi:hypothetical protein
MSVIFFLFFNLKISRYVRNTYPGVSRQYPISKQYPIPIWRKSEIFALPSCHAYRAAIPKADAEQRGVVEGQHVIAEPAREMADEFPSYVATEISVVEAIMHMTTKHSLKFACPQTRLSHTITVNALDGFNKQQQFIETLTKKTHIIRTLVTFTL